MCRVLWRKDAGFTSLKGNSKQKQSFYKETYGGSAIFYRTVNGFSHSFIVFTLFLLILLSWCQNKLWHWIDIILSLKNVAVWSNHAVMIFIENHFETYFCQVFIFKKILKNRNFDFLVPNAWQLQRKCIHPHPPAPEGKQQKHWKIKHYETGRYKSRTGSTRTTSLGRINSDRLGPTRIEEKNKNKIKVDSDQLGS